MSLQCNNSKCLDSLNKNPDHAEATSALFAILPVQCGVRDVTLGTRPIKTAFVLRSRQQLLTAS